MPAVVRPPSDEAYIRVEKNNTAALKTYQSLQYRRAHNPDSPEGDICHGTFVETNVQAGRVESIAKSLSLQ
jgi:hypothetical protein